MTKRHPDEVIVDRWTVDAATLRDFIQEMRFRYRDSPFPPNDLLDACEEGAQSGLEVVCRDDAVFVGSWCLAFLYNDVSAVRLEERWIQFEMEGGQYHILVPIARKGRAIAEHIVNHYIRLGAEEARRAIAERQAPTWSNRLLDIFEGHFVLVFLGLFFIGIPMIVVVICWLRGSFE